MKKWAEEKPKNGNDKKTDSTIRINQSLDEEIEKKIANIIVLFP